MRLIASTAFGLEAVVARELSGTLSDAAALAKAVQDVAIGRAGQVTFEGNWDAVALANLHLRCADRVAIEIAKFPCKDFDALFDTIRAIDWSRWISPDGKIDVKAKSLQSGLSSVPAIQRAAKRAIVDNMLAKHGGTTLPESGPAYRIDVNLFRDEAIVTLDTTGRSLHRRGYRIDVGGAALKETLAAALVLLSFWKRDRPLADPFCGSGTIAIEAAMIGRNIAPGKARPFAFESWMDDPSMLADLRASAVGDEQPRLNQRLSASDVDAKVLRAARDNAERAGVLDDLHIQHAAAKEFRSSRRFGCLITNPPYGRRLTASPASLGARPPAAPRSRSTSSGSGAKYGMSPQQRGRPPAAANSHPDDRRGGRWKPSIDPELRQVYRDLVDVFRRLPTWSHYVFTAVQEFESIVDKPADRRRKLYNGRIECTYFQYHGPKPVLETREIESPAKVARQPSSGEPPEDSPEKVSQPRTTTVHLLHAEGEPAFGALGPEAKRQSDEFANRLRKRARHLRRYPSRRDIHCYRIYDRDVPEVPLVIDRYEEHLHVTEYFRPHERDLAAHANWLEQMVAVAGEALDVPAEKVHFKSRGRQKGLTQHEKFSETGRRMQVREGGLKFWVNLDDYIDTGLFLDHRVTRSMVRDAVKGQRLLNVFGYTGSFSVYAADGAARETLTVDLSHTYCDWARDNLKLNGFSLDQHRVRCQDVRQFVSDYSGPAFDVMVVDPPTFSNSKKTDQDWEVHKHATSLLRDLLTHLVDGGKIFFSSNFRRIKFDPAELPLSAHREISRQTVPEDFRDKRVHRCWLLTK